LKHGCVVGVYHRLRLLECEPICIDVKAPWVAGFGLRGDLNGKVLL
jgi:hypothetical protein